MTVDEQARALRRAAARARCRVETLGPRETAAGPALAGRVVCPNGWAAARLLLAAAAEDARTAGARDLALELRAGSDDETFARRVFDFVRERVAFVRESGEVFAASWYTLAVGAGDCDDHARLAYALLAAGGVPARLAFLYKPASARLGPSHVVAQAGVGGAWRWLETTIGAEFGEEPFRAAERLGLRLRRSDIASGVRTMTEKDLPPVPPTFVGGDAATIARDAAALASLGYLCESFEGLSARDPAFRAAVLAFQRAHGLEPDGLIGPMTRGVMAQAMGAIGEVRPVLSRHLSDRFFDEVRAMAARMRAKGATITGADLLAVWLLESGVRNVPNRQGYPYGGLNQMGPDQRRAAGFSGSFAEWLALDEDEQLPFVERYYENATGGRLSLLRDKGSLYLVNFLPAYASHADEPDYVLARRKADDDGSEAWRKAHLSDIYAANRGLDTDGDGAIRVRDLDDAVERAQRGNAAYWRELTARLGESSSPRSIVGAIVGAAALLAGMGTLAWWVARS